MDNLRTSDIPFEEIENGALILLLLRDCKTWEELCGRFQYATPPDLEFNTNAMMLHRKLGQMRDLGLLSFTEERVNEKTAIRDLRATDLWQKIRLAMGGMSLHESALLSRHSKGMTIVPVFGRPGQHAPVDVFVLMPFDEAASKFFRDYIRRFAEELGIVIKRADDRFAPEPFMEKVWTDICAARLILADCTNRNPNVFYEIGLAHAIGKKVVLLTRSRADIPSDLLSREFLEYGDEPDKVVFLLRRLKEIFERYLGVPETAAKDAVDKIFDELKRAGAV